MAPALHEFVLRLKALFRKRRIDREMTEELEFHRTLLRERLLREGVALADVDAATRRTFGNTGRWHERLQELWQFPALEHLLRDLRYSARMLWKSPGFTAVAIITLALGIGANEAIFSLVNGLLLRPLPVPHSEQLVVLRIEQGRAPQYTMGAPFFRGLERRHEVFSDVFAYDHAGLQVRGSSGNEEVEGQFVSGEFFRALQTPPLLGRLLTPDDDRLGGNRAGMAVVIGEQFWARWFGRAADVVGRKLEIDNTVFVVVGVTPKRFIGADPTQRPEIYVPLAAEAIVDAPDSMIAAGHHGWWLRVMGRLRPGITLEQANAALLPISMPIVREGVPDAGWVADAEKNHFHFRAEPGSRGFTYLRSMFSKPLMAVFAMCGGILLLACLNLASLLLARSASRERELATRLALGASRRRLLQQLLIESLLIALMGTAAGLAVAPAVSKSLAAMLLRGGGPRGMYLDTSLDWRVLAFAGLIAVTATLLIGLLPALRATAGSLSDQIKDGQSGHTVERRHILPAIMMASEVGLALMLVVGAGLLAESLLRLYKAGVGFDPHALVNIDFDMDKQRREGDALVQLYRQIGEGLSHQPGVKSVSFSLMTPLTGNGWDQDYSVPGGISHDLNLNMVSPAYFQTMRIPMLEGRDFRWSDDKASGYKIVINQAAAKLFFPGQDAIGQRILGPAAKDPTAKLPFEVIGVVGNAKYYELRETATPVGYVTISQGGGPTRSYTAMVRVDGSPGPLAAAARSITARLAPDVPAPVMTTMNSVLDDSISAERLMAALSAYFAACALFVTAIGLYGTLAYSTARRTSEIGIRMALGAGRGQVVTMVLRENTVIAFAGGAVGLIAAVLGSRALASFLYGTSARDPWVLIGSVVALSAIASAASLLPALRAARTDPMAAIRCE
jgi:putative ABC transport system permease protein